MQQQLMYYDTLMLNYETTIQKYDIRFRFRDEDILRSGLDFMQIFTCENSETWADEFYRLIDIVSLELPGIKETYLEDCGRTVWSDWYWSVEPEKKRISRDEWELTEHTILCLQRIDSSSHLSNKRPLQEETKEDATLRKILEVFPSKAIVTVSAHKIDNLYPACKPFKNNVNILSSSLYLDKNQNFVLDIENVFSENIARSIIEDIQKEPSEDINVCCTPEIIDEIRDYAALNDKMILYNNAINVICEQFE